MAVLAQLPAKPLVVGFPKQVFALDPHPQRGVLKQAEAERLLGTFCLEQGGMGGAIREQQAVAAELAIVLHITEVAAIAPVVATISGVFVEPLIDPIPDKSALQTWMIAKRLPIVGVAPQTVAHGVGIFAEDQRSVLAGQADPLGQRPLWHRREGLILMGSGIHGADDVSGRGIGPAPLVLHRTARVAALDPAIHGIVGRAVTRLVAERPDDDGGVVEIPCHHAGRPLQKGVAPGGIPRQPPHRSHAVGLQIRLVHHIETEPIAEAIEVGVVGIVGAAHRIEVVALHQQQIPLHGGAINGITLGGMVFMTVGTTNKQRLTVDPQQTTTDLHHPKAHIARLTLDGAALLVQQGQGQAIEMRRLGAPLARRSHVEPELGAIVIRPFLINGLGADRLAQGRDPLATVIEIGLYRQPSPIGDLQGNLETTIPIAGIQLGGHPDIHQMAERFVQQADGAEDPRQPPHILIFQIGAVGPAQHQHRQPVATALQIRSQIEFGGQAAVLGVADPATVAKKVEGTANPVKDDPALAACQPAGGQIELAGVATGGILCRHARWITGKGVLDIGVDGAIGERPRSRIGGIQLPVARHCNGASIHQILRQPTLGHQFGSGKEGEAPLAIEQETGGRGQITPGIRFAAPAEHGGMGCQPVYRRNSLSLPILTRHYLPEHSLSPC